MSSSLAPIGAAACAAAALLACAAAPRPPAPGRAPPPAATLGRAERELLAAAIDTLVARRADPAVVCVTILADPAGPYAPDAALLGALSTRGRVAAPGACPRTYPTGMVTVTDPSGRPVEGPPVGYVQPRLLQVGRPLFAAPGYAHVYAREEQGGMGWDAVCTAQYRQGRPYVWCRLGSVWNH